MAKKKNIVRESRRWTTEEYNYLKLVGENIIRIKKEKKLKSKELCEILDMDKSNYRRIEVGNNNISLLLIRRIAKALDVDLKELTKEENS